MGRRLLVRAWFRVARNALLLVAKLVRVARAALAVVAVACTEKERVRSEPSS